MAYRIIIILIGILLGYPTAGLAADYQWSVPVEGKDHESRAFLWIPPSCQQVRGLIFCNQVILEKLVCDNLYIREACASQGLGIVIVFRSPLTTFNYSEGADKILQKILDDLATESGYSEVAKAPLLTLGHSGGAIGAWNIAYWNPKRVLGILTLHSAAMIAPPSWDNKNGTNGKGRTDGIPVMAVSGENESWNNNNGSIDKHWHWLRGELLNLRGRYYNAQVCEVVQPGAGHFNFDEHLAKLCALFIKKAAKYRVPSAQKDRIESSELKTIPEDAGWLTDINIIKPNKYAPASFKQYKGDPSLAFWHMDEELARAVEAFPAFYGGKTDQRITFVQDGKPLPASWITELKFEPLEDGLSFKIKGDFLTKTPEDLANGGLPLNHSTSPVAFSLIGGWGGGGEQISPDTFKIRFDHFGLSRTCCNLQIMAYNKGDSRFKYAEQAGQIKFPERNKDGRPQTITFQAQDNVFTGTKSLELKGTSNVGLPISYFVRSGPAEIKGNKLIFTSIPPRSKFPVKVLVVAYQWGRTTEPLTQTAEPVEKIIMINKTQ